MLGRNHVISSVSLTAVSICVLNEPVEFLTLSMPMCLLGVSIGALIPDLDHKNSLASKALKIPLYKLFSHRGFLHTLFGWLLFTLVCFILSGFVPNILGLGSMAHAFCIGLVLGYLLHLLEDSWSQAGIRWLAPFTPKDDYAYHKYQTILRKPRRFKKVRKYHQVIKVPIRHVWGRGYVVGGTFEQALVFSFVILMILSFVYRIVTIL